MMKKRQDTFNYFPRIQERAYRSSKGFQRIIDKKESSEYCSSYLMHSSTNYRLQLLIWSANLILGIALIGQGKGRQKTRSYIRAVYPRYTGTTIVSSIRCQIACHESTFLTLATSRSSPSQARVIFCDVSKPTTVQMLIVEISFRPIHVCMQARCQVLEHQHLSTIIIGPIQKR